MSNKKSCEVVKFGKLFQFLIIVTFVLSDVHGAPEMVVADEVTSTSVHLAWCPVGTPNHYLIQYLTSDNNTLNSMTTTGPVNSTVIHGLSSFKDYVFTVRGVYGEDDSILSQPISISVKTKPSGEDGFISCFFGLIHFTLATLKEI